MLEISQLHRAAMVYDLGAAINRIILHGWEDELAFLSDEQLHIYADATGQAPKDAPCSTSNESPAPLPRQIR